MNENKAASLIDLIYDAALDEPVWVAVMNCLADMVGGGVTAFIRKNLTTGQGSGLYGRITADQFTDYFGRFAQANPFTRAVALSQAGTTLIDWQLVSKPALLQSAYYNEFLLRRDIHAVMGLMVWRQGADTAIINLTRPPGRGEFSPQDAQCLAPFMPHLRRAVALAERMPPWGAMAAGLEAALDAWQAAVAILDRAGRIVYANAATERIFAQRDGLGASRGVIIATHPATARRLAGLIRQAAEADPPAGGNVAVPRPSGRRPYAVQVMPCRPARLGLFPTPARVMVCLTDFDMAAGPSITTLRQVFGLTSAQAAVATAIARGGELSDIAAELGISRFTVRRHLADVMARTDTHSQAALVQLLLRLSDFGSITTGGQMTRKMAAAPVSTPSASRRSQNPDVAAGQRRSHGLRWLIGHHL